MSGEQTQAAAPANDASIPSTEAGPHYSYQYQYRKCGKPCKTCAEGKGHGPYWYMYWKQGKRVRTKYLGKHLPPGIKVPETSKFASAVAFASNETTPVSA